MMKKVFAALLILVAGFFWTAKAGACFSIVVGREASDDGAVLLAHNEDDSGPSPLMVNAYKLPVLYHNKGAVISLNNELAIPQVRRTCEFLWLEVPEQEFADAYFNENGVSITSNECHSREDRPETTGGGIGFMLRRLIAERAGSSREAVRLAGEWIQQYGYTSSGRTYLIADAREGWLLHAVKGKHWVAQRVPDDQAAVIANCYTIGKVDLADRNNFMGSADIIEYAQRRGWYRPERDGSFDFARAYSEPEELKQPGNIMRWWRGVALLAKKDFPMNQRLPFSFTPKREIRVLDLIRILRDHYEGTDYDLTDHYKKGSPNLTANRTICTESTQYSFVAQLREELEAELNNLVWIAFSRPDANAYAPWYVAIEEPPAEYARGEAATALASHFLPSIPPVDGKGNRAFVAFARLAELVDRVYRERNEEVQKMWRNFENLAMKSVKSKEKEFAYLLKTDRAIARKIITTFVQDLEFRKWFFTSDLIRKYRK